MCNFYKFKDAGQSQRKPRAELRKIGKAKRVSRHDLGDQGSGATYRSPGGAHGLNPREQYER